MRSIFVLGFTAIIAASAAASDLRIGATAAHLSATSIAGIKDIAGEDKSLNKAQRECINSIPSDAIAPTYQGLLQSYFTAKQLASFDLFYSSSLGSRLAQANLARISTEVAFTAEENAQLEAELERLSVNRVWDLKHAPNFREQVGKAVKQVLDACLKPI